MIARCYACNSAAIGYALRCSDGGPARGAHTFAAHACYRHAWDPYDHPELQLLAPMAPARVAPCTVKWAIEFAAEHHRHSDPETGGLWAVRLIRVRRTIAVAIVGRPKSRHLQDGFTAEVTRLCIGGVELERNACSLLYARCRRAAAALGYTRLITYTLASESGKSLRGAGFREVAEVRGEQWDRPGRRRRARKETPDRVRWQLALNTAPVGAV